MGNTEGMFRPERLHEGWIRELKILLKRIERAEDLFGVLPVMQKLDALGASARMIVTLEDAIAHFQKRVEELKK